MSYRVRVELCDQQGKPLYWAWVGEANQGDKVSFAVANHANPQDWTAIEARPVGQITKAEQEQIDPILGKAYREFGIEAADLVMAAYWLGRMDP